MSVSKLSSWATEGMGSEYENERYFIQYLHISVVVLLISIWVFIIYLTTDEGIRLLRRFSEKKKLKTARSVLQVSLYISLEFILRKSIIHGSTDW